MSEVRFHPAAVAEYEAAYAWYWASSPRAAERFETELGRLSHVLGDRADQFPFFNATYRFAVLRRFPYSLIYREDGDVVTVFAVAHAQRLPGFWENR